MKNIGRGMKVNAVSTAFGSSNKNYREGDLVYRNKKITLEQTALLDGHNPLSLPPVPEPPKT